MAIQLTPDEISQATPVNPAESGPSRSNPAIQLSPDEIAQAQPVHAQGTDTLRDFTAQQLVDLQKADPKFSITEAFSNRSDLQKDPAITQKIADARHQSRMQGNFMDKYKGDTALETAGNLVGAGVTAAADVAKGFGKQIWNYAQGLTTPVTAMVTAPFVAPETTENLLDIGQRQITENLAGSELGATEAAGLVPKAAGFLARKAHIAKPLEDYTPEDRLKDLFDAMGSIKQNQEITKGRGAVLSATGSHVVDDLAANGVPVRPEEVAELASGDPFSWYAMGKAFHGASALVPKRVGVALERGATALGDVSAKVVGKGIETAADITKMGATAASKVAPAAGAILGTIKGAEHGATGAFAGSALGLKAGQGVASGLRKVAGSAGAISDIGEQVSGKAPVAASTAGDIAQGIKDIVTSAPGAAVELGKGAAFDLGLAAVTSEETPEERAGVGLGTVFGALGAAKKVGGRVLSGQIIAPRSYVGPGRDVPALPGSKQSLLPLVQMHDEATKALPPGDALRVNAMRAFAQGVGKQTGQATDLFHFTDPAKMQAALEAVGMPTEQAKTLSEQEGFFSADINGKRIIGVRNIDAAPHESFHAFQDVIGESANRQLDALVKQAFGPVWEREGARYAGRIPGMTDPAQWREHILDRTRTGVFAAAEKVSQQVFNKLSHDTGAVPDPDAVRQLASGEMARILAEGQKRNPTLSLPEVQERMWRDVLSPQEAQDAGDRYLARELAAENFDAVFKNRGPALGDPPGLFSKFANVVAKTVSLMGGNALEGRVSQIGEQPLNFDIAEAVRNAAKANIKPTIEPAKNPAKNPAKVSALPGTPERRQQEAEAAQAHAEEAPDVKPAPTPEVPNPQSPREVLGVAAEAIAQGTGVKINYHSAPNEPAAAITSNREQRRTIIETFRTMPQAARALWEKTFFPDRVEKRKTGFQLWGWAPEVFASNAHKVAQTLNKLPGFVSPYELDPKTGSFTEAGWKQLYEDTQNYVRNQTGGRTGAGEELVVPKIPGIHAPPEVGTPAPIDQTKADFINLLFGQPLPKTARIKAGEMPRNIVGQEISAATKPGRIEIPLRQKPSFEGEKAEALGIEGRPIMEVNPLRNQLEKAAAAAGVEMPSLIEANQRLNVENIADIQHAPEAPEFRGNTITIAAGFQPNSAPRAIKAAAVRDQSDGKVFEGTSHFNAVQNASDQGRNLWGKRDDILDGFTTNEGEFLDRDEAAKRAEEFNQLDPKLKEPLDGSPLHSSDVGHLNFQPKSGSEAMQQLKDMSPDELRNFKGKYGGGGTAWAFEAGANAKTPEDLQAFRSAREVFETLRKDAMSQKDYAAAMDLGTRGQFAREAFEAATGRQIDKDEPAPNFGLPKDYQPPLAPAQLQPKQQEDLGREAWLDRSGNVINAPSGHFNTAANILEDRGIKVPELPYDSYVEMYKLGYNRLVKEPNGKELLVNGAPLTPAARRKLDDVAAQQGLKVFKDSEPLTAKSSDLQRFRSGTTTEVTTFQPNKDVEDVAKKYSEDSGVPYRPLGAAKPVDVERAKKIADEYEAAKHEPNDPKVQASYDALAKETVDQWNAIKDAGYTLEPWTEGGEPYKDSEAMMADVRDNKHLFFKPTGTDIKGDNLMLKPSGVDDLLVNDVFRAVHDFFGHAKEGLSFGPKGEYNAWRAHSGMYSAEAQGALAAETLAQNSWVNFGPHLRNEAGNIPAKGEPGYKPLTERPFAEQKNTVIAAEFQPATAAGRKLEEQGYRIERADSNKFGTGTRNYFVRDKDGNVISELQSSQVGPDHASVDLVTTDQHERGKGIAETLYRELATDLQKQGVTRLTGYVVDTAPAKIRAKLFGDEVPNIPPGMGGPGHMESTIRPDAQFAPKKEDWELKPSSSGFSKAWILPDGTPVQLGNQWHHDFLNENPDIQKKYGLKPPGDWGWVDADVVRKEALKKGFARMNYDTRNGLLTVEAREADWPTIAPAVKHFVESNLKKVDRVRVYQYNKGVTQISDSATADLFNLPKEERSAAIPFIGTPGEVTETSPQARGYQYLPPSKKELEKIRDEGGGQTFTPDGKVWTPKGASDIVSLASVNIPQEDLSQGEFKAAIKPFADVLKQPGMVTGVFSFQKDGKPTVSIDINAVVPQKHRENTLAFAKANDQDSIWDAAKNEVVPAGGKGNTVLKTPEEIARAAEALMAGKPVNIADIQAGKNRVLSNPEIAHMSAQELSDYFPESVIPKDKKQAIGSDVLNSPRYKAAGSEDAAVEDFGDKLAEFAKEHQDQDYFDEGARWYSDFSKELHKEFGDQAGLFAEFLAATSPQTGPATNFHYAYDAMQSLKAGRFAKILPKFEEGLKMIEDGSWEPWYLDQVKQGNVEKPPKNYSSATFLAHWIDHFNLRPTQSNGKLYGMHTAAVLQVLARRWLDLAKGPKTRNFVANLFGSSHEATIDLWADRTMRRLGYEGYQDRWRILPTNGSGVTDKEFAFAQKAFANAAKKLNMKPDALQGALWFAEKKLWEKNNWGALDLGSYMNELPKMEAKKAQFEKTAAGLVEPRNIGQTRLQPSGPLPDDLGGLVKGPDGGFVNGTKHIWYSSGDKEWYGADRKKLETRVMKSFSEASQWLNK